MKALGQVLSLGRGHLRTFLLIAVLASLGTAATLLEPWIYRAIIDDIAGVFLSLEPPTRAATIAGDVQRSVPHVPSSGRRLFREPLKKVNEEEERREIELDGPPGKLLVREGYFRDMVLAGEAAAG
jgi:hypothetical protein